MTPLVTAKCPIPDPSEAAQSATSGANLLHALDTGGTSLLISLSPRWPPPLSLESRRQRTPLSLKRPLLPWLPRVSYLPFGGARCTSGSSPSPRGLLGDPRRPPAPPAIPRAPRCVPTPAVGLRPGKARRGLAAGDRSPRRSSCQRRRGADARPSARRRRRRRAPRSASRAVQPGGEREGDGNGGGAAGGAEGGGGRAELAAAGPALGELAASPSRRAARARGGCASGPRRSSAPSHPRPPDRSLAPPPRRGRRTFPGRPQPRPLRARVGRGASAEGARVRGGACVVERARPRPLPRHSSGGGERLGERVETSPSLRAEVGPWL